MQINRLFEIMYILLEKKMVTAKELAERFEVSVRTIYRDVEALSGAGIPVYMSKGKGGGIGIMPEFVLNKAYLSEGEKRDILSALQSLNTVDRHSVNDTLLKVGSLFGAARASWIEIDYSDWGHLFQEQFETSKKALLEQKILQFEYVSSKGERSVRRVEPVTLWFKERNWYLKAFCLERQAMRLFRLSRMQRVKCTEETFIPRLLFSETPEAVYETKETEALQPMVTIKAEIDASQRFRLLDEFSGKEITKTQNGSFIVTMEFIEDEWIYGYLLSFGPYLRVLEPERIRQGVKKRLQKTLENYL